ncbi:hypothetical protein [Phytohabitans kaempferiae]|uniref:Uncharacterized protein n=1 Tax=Phytohabitans kaempferiae TaxID=1620943 RepID=A0ABV6MAN1_9ACTN
MLNGGIETLAYAGKRDGQVEASEFLLEYGWPYGHFTFLDRQIEWMLLNKEAPYPVSDGSRRGVPAEDGFRGLPRRRGPLTTRTGPRTSSPPGRRSRR